MTHEEMAQGLYELARGELREYPDAVDALLAGAAALRAMEWREWPKDNDEGGEYPPNEETVVIYCGNWESKPIQLGGIIHRCGTYGPSGASHWLPLPEPPKGQV